MIQVETDHQGKCLIVRLAGEGDFDSARPLWSEFNQLLQQQPPRMVLDMSQVSFASSVFMATLIQLRGKLRQQGATLCMFGLQQPVATAFEVARLDWIIPTFSTLDEATASL